MPRRRHRRDHERGKSGTGSHPQASLTCRAIQSAVGDGVTPTQRIRLRSCRRIRRPYSNLNEIVGTTKRSIEAIPPVWLRRNVLQPCAKQTGFATATGLVLFAREPRRVLAEEKLPKSN